jgi:hypothetical protein
MQKESLCRAGDRRMVVSHFRGCHGPPLKDAGQAHRDTYYEFGHGMVPRKRIGASVTAQALVVETPPEDGLLPKNY